VFSPIPVVRPPCLHRRDGPGWVSRRFRPSGGWSGDLSGDQAVPMFKIYVGNLDPRVKIEQVRELFSPFVTIEDAVLVNDTKSGKPKGFAIIMVRDPDLGRAAVKATQGKRLLGKTLTINEVMKKGQAAAKSAKEARQGPFGPHFNRQGGGVGGRGGGGPRAGGGLRRGMNRGPRGAGFGGGSSAPGFGGPRPSYGGGGTGPRSFDSRGPNSSLPPGAPRSPGAPGSSLGGNAGGGTGAPRPSIRRDEDRGPGRPASSGDSPRSE
jgi:RNA recognition motif. (a.k.a. RRM, RBD, or RNP domain)